MFLINNDMKAMEKYAEENYVPIMDKKGLKFIVDYIKNNDGVGDKCKGT